MDTLENTNRVLSDLERKLSIVSSTSTQHSQSSSVIINRNLSDIGKQNVSNVLSYIKTAGDDVFNTNDLYEERINRSKSSSVEPEPSLSEKLKPKHQLRKGYKGRAKIEYSDDEDDDDTKVPPSAAAAAAAAAAGDTTKTSPINKAATPTTPSPSVTSNTTPKQEHEVDSLEYTELKRVTKDIESDDEDDTYIDEAEDDADYEYEDDEELQLPPSPPRSPPREIDPDKLYGLYDFSGPDPSHCTIVRDEPVYLLNDEDNYWWLVQKLTKEEKPEDALSDDEDGKIGFVPAECLETYGERLARLNCFKNEELEKMNAVEGNSVDSLQKQPQVTLSGNGVNKSVTFEDFGDMLDKVVIQVDSEDEHDVAAKSPSQQFPDHIFSIPAGALGPPIAEKQGSEVLSDVFPSEVPLVIPKNGKKRQSSSSDLHFNQLSDHENEVESPVAEVHDIEKSPASTKTITPLSTPKSTPTIQPTAVAVGNHPIFDPPKRPSQQPDTVSIGSFSPDTPPKKEKPDESPRADVKAFSRSLILERLNQVTADIEEHFSMQDDLNYSDMEKIMFDLESREDLASEDDYPNDRDDNSLDSTVRRSVATDSDIRRKSADSCAGDIEVSNETFTPYTSTASLVDKGSKDKSIHDMFVPILGKFDELAERLEELNDILR